MSVKPTPQSAGPSPLGWLESHKAEIKDRLAKLVRIESISNDGRHTKALERSADLVRDLMAEAGLEAKVLRGASPYPYAFGQKLDAPGKPTVLLYSHHDVQPVAGFEKDWLQSSPWELTEREGRLFGRGAVDDKGGFVAQLSAVAAFLKTSGKLPVNIKMIVEGEEEIGSPNLIPFLAEHRDLVQADVIVVCDTENAAVGVPGITYSLRGNFSLFVEVESAKAPSHSGLAGGALADSALALNVILSRLYWGNGKLPIPGYYDAVRPLSDAQRASIERLAPDEKALWKDMGVLPGVKPALEAGVSVYEQTWRRPAISIIAQEASSVANASNQVLPKARAIVSCRIVPDQDPKVVCQQLKDFLSADPPWGVKVTVTERDKPAPWWMTDPEGPAFEAAVESLRAGFGAEPALLGAGGSIGFVGPLAELCGNAPSLLFGINDSLSNAHAPNESVHEGDWFKLMASLVHLFENLAQTPDGRVK